MKKQTRATMITFTEFNAGSLGVDIEVVSGTKYLSGGASVSGCCSTWAGI